MTFVSVIIPFNKPERYLKDCLDSLANQDLTDGEVILIVNGVEENIDDLLDYYSTKFNLVVKSFDDEITVGKARNVGLDVACGEYVYFIDSDDYVHGDALNRLIDVARNSSADFINGERINTAFIRVRFDEELEKQNRVPLNKANFNDRDFSFKLLVGKNTNPDEFISTLHALIKKDLIGNVRFDNQQRYDTDYDFILNILENLNTFIGVENAYYAKRTREDPINLTSLNQETKEDNFLIKCNNYQKSVKTLKNNKKYETLTEEMTNKMFHLYENEFKPGFLASPNKKWRNEYFNKIAELSKDFYKLKLSFIQKKEIKALETKNKQKYSKIVRFTSYFDKLTQALTSKRKLYEYIYKYYNSKPLNEKQIIFESFRGEFYSDSPKYLYEYLYDNYGDEFDYVWVVDDLNIKIPHNPRKVKRFSLKFYKEVARSKYWVINGRQSRRVKKRNSQIIVSTWHGTPLKKLGLDMDNVYTEDPSIKRSYIKVAKAWDYLISPNRFTSNIYRSAFNYNGEILESGYPRNDILYNAGEDFINGVKAKLNIPSDKKVILYAPTWRDDEFQGVGSVDFKLKLELDKLKKSLGEDYIVLVRTHYFIADNLDLNSYGDFAINVSGYDDIAELYLISDILITDYSSVFFDYANLKRPILFYTYDLEKYENTLRGFYLDVKKDLPGPLLFTTEEVIASILDINSVQDEYCEKYDEFYERFCGFEDGNASKRIVDKIWNP